MNRKHDWLNILAECRSNVQKQIAPLLHTASGSQPSLGVGAGGDPLRKIDLAAEKAVVDVLCAKGVSFTLVSEESGIKQYGDDPGNCYVTTDPIDRTTNLSRGIPFYATSIAVSNRLCLSSVFAALVSDLFHGATYTAEEGRGACRDGRKIAPSSNVTLEDAVIGIDLNSHNIGKSIPSLMLLIGKTKHARHFGANALELCYVADGTIDAFIDVRGRLRTTDMAGAWLVLKEAGAIVTGIDGKPVDATLDPRQRVNLIASANKKIHKALLSLMKLGKEEE